LGIDLNPEYVELANNRISEEGVLWWRLKKD
jgi:DNA modification methylase